MMIQKLINLDRISCVSIATKEEALAVTKGYNVYVATIKIEWEE